MGRGRSPAPRGRPAPEPRQGSPSWWSCRRRLSGWPRRRRGCSPGLEGKHPERLFHVKRPDRRARAAGPRTRPRRTWPAGDPAGARWGTDRCRARPGELDPRRPESPEGLGRGAPRRPCRPPQPSLPPPRHVRQTSRPMFHVEHRASRSADRREPRAASPVQPLHRRSPRRPAPSNPLELCSSSKGP